ncbi:SDR family oxidoreductase [Leucobacter allii]|uniref:SDR family oxidoreductase n=1 Tax=Leucobacter allii TaxID=2932247 RepID=A0ABY4FQA8_9MICO|nr:SDR family oxidoreductase [Leucobacter allii]UOQ58474.1 SDR family oxidoreductase [Leucobacter allii]UOR03056.1 SDR family oxidoreductase [Leucobacter allii]
MRKNGVDMDLQLAGRRAFISGSTRGIGYAIAAELADEGADVVVNGRDEAGVRAALAGLGERGSGPGHRGIVGDLGDAADAARVLAELDAMGEVDILVNNVGVFELSEFAEVDDARWLRTFEVNVMSGVRLARHLLPGMLDRGWGRIVGVGSESGVNVPVDMVPYGVTKAAMIALGNGLAKHTRGTGVTVNTVLGGPCDSDGVRASVAAVAAAHGVSESAMRASIIGQNRTSLLGRFIEPAEIARLVAYLASPLASATNGAAVRADGGVLTAML